MKFGSPSIKTAPTWHPNAEDCEHCRLLEARMAMSERFSEECRLDSIISRTANSKLQARVAELERERSADAEYRLNRARERASRE